ncbi:ABC transporter permease [Bacillus sp. FSL W7-1360]
MNLRTLARRNVTGHAQRYAAYFISCVFAVTVFFLYAQFIYHPDVANGEIRGGSNVRAGMIAAQWMIVLFSVFFIAYSNRAFLQVRSKEFGLLSLFGMSGRQLRKLIYYEQTILSLLAIVVGLLLGTVFSKLFLLFLSSILVVENPIAFAFVPKAYIITVVAFIVLFQVLTLLSFWKMRGQEVTDLLKEARKPKSMPKTSAALTVLALLFLGGGYGLAVITTGDTLILTMFPVLILVVIGTYFFFTQGTVALYKRLYANKKGLMSGTRLITRTNILFRLKDYARMLFLTSVIGAVVLTASGTVYMLFDTILEDGARSMPQSISWVEEDPDTYATIHPEEVEEKLTAYDAEILYQINETMPYVSAQGSATGEEATFSGSGFLLSETQYNQLAKTVNVSAVQVEEGEVLTNAHVLDWEVFPPKLDVEIGDTEETYDAGQLEDEPLLSYASVYVLADHNYNQVVKNNEIDMWRYIGYELKDWREHAEVSEAIADMVDEERVWDVSLKPLNYVMLMQAFSLVVAIGLFISLLFFVVQGSMLYLKLFTELEDMKRQLFSLNRLGMTKKEMKRVLDQQMRFLFFVPAVVGSVHASFAYVMLSNMMGVNLVINALLVIGVYMLFQVGYYLITRVFYFRAVLKDL